MNEHHRLGVSKRIDTCRRKCVFSLLLSLSRSLLSLCWLVGETLSARLIIVLKTDSSLLASLTAGAVELILGDMTKRFNLHWQNHKSAWTHMVDADDTAWMQLCVYYRRLTEWDWRNWKTFPQLRLEILTLLTDRCWLSEEEIWSESVKKTERSLGNCADYLRWHRMSPMEYLLQLVQRKLILGCAQSMRITIRERERKREKKRRLQWLSSFHYEYHRWVDSHLHSKCAHKRVCI